MEGQGAASTGCLKGREGLWEFVATLAVVLGSAGGTQRQGCVSEHTTKGSMVQRQRLMGEMEFQSSAWVQICAASILVQNL